MGRGQRHIGIGAGKACHETPIQIIKTLIKHLIMRNIVKSLNSLISNRNAKIH